MFSVITDRKAHNCNEIDDWTNNSRDFNQIDTQTLVTNHAINYAVTFDFPNDDYV